jgi:hypothetical protein
MEPEGSLPPLKEPATCPIQLPHYSFSSTPSALNNCVEIIRRLAERSEVVSLENHRPYNFVQLVSL